MGTIKETPEQAAAILDVMTDAAKERTRRTKRLRIWLLIAALLIVGPGVILSYWFLLAVAAGVVALFGELTRE